MDKYQKKTGQLIQLCDELDKIVTRYSKSYQSINDIGNLWKPTPTLKP